jgi:predicted PurR-regulated permease PerM
MATSSSSWIAHLPDPRYIAPVAASKTGRIVLIFAAIVVVGAGIKLAAPLLVPVLVASFIAIVTAPLVMWLCDRGIPRLIAVMSGLFLDVAAGAALGVPLAGAVGTFTARVPSYAPRLSGQLGELELWLAGNGIHLESIYDFSASTWMLNFAATMAQFAASFVSQMVLVLLIVAFMLFESTGLREKLAKIATPGQIQELSAAAREVNTYLVAKTVMSLLTGALVFLWCLWRGIDVPVLWGLLAYLLNYIPTVGQIIAATPAIALALIQFGPGQALVVAAGFGGINLAIGAIEPRVMGHALGLSPLVVLVSMVVWGWLLGPVGALVSAPLTMVIKHSLAHSDELRWLAELLGPSPKPSGKANENSPDTADELSRA